MKTLLALLILATVATQSLLAQTTTVTMLSNGTQSISVPAGQVFQMLMWDTNSTYNRVRVDGRDLLSAANAIVAGPKTVDVISSNGNSLTFTYKLTADTQTATANVASQAVVIPSTGIANADIIFESSPDLVTWTAAVAGNYVPTTPNRFFRVRLVTH